MGQLLIATAFLGAAMLILRQLQERRVRATSLTGMALLLLMTISVTQFVPEFKKPDKHQTAALATVRQDDQPSGRAGTETSEALPTNSRSGLVARVGAVRRRFMEGCRINLSDARYVVKPEPFHIFHHSSGCPT